MFNPMMGRRSIREQSVSSNRTVFGLNHSKGTSECDAGEILPWLENAPVHALEFFLKLQSCKKIHNGWLNVEKCMEKLVADEKIQLTHIMDPNEAFFMEHLLKGTAQITGIDF